jgi:hypothetical protein
MSRSVDTRFHIETYFRLDTEDPAVVHFVAPPVFMASTLNSPIVFSVGAHDSSGYRLQYSLVNPKQQYGFSVAGYSIPSGVSLNPHNGLFAWDFSPDLISFGEYTFAVRVESYDEQNNLRGFTIFDFQISHNTMPAGSISDNRSLDEKNRIYVSDEETVTVTFQHTGSGDWELSLYTVLPTENASLSVSQDFNSKVGSLRLKNTLGIQQSNPYLVVVRASKNDEENLSYDIPYLFFTQNTDFNELITFSDELFKVDPSTETRFIWPNPIDEVLSFWDNEGKPAKFSVLKLTGEEIISGQLTGNDFLIFSGVAPGVYIVRIDDKFYRIVKSV